MPIDMQRIKSNVAKMAAQNAPEEDIDGYIKSEGTSIEAVRAFNRPEYRGGAMSPANIAAQKEVGKTALGTELMDVPIAATNLINSAGLGIPGTFAKLTTGKDIPEATSPGGRAFSDVFGLMGAFGGPVAEKGIELAGKGAKVLSNINKFSKLKNQVKLAEEVQNTLMSQKRSVIDKYGKEYENIVGKSNKKVNISQAVNNFLDEGQSLLNNPEFAQQIAAKNPEANRIMDMVAKVSKSKDMVELSAVEVDKLQKYIKNLPGIKNKLNQASKNGFHSVQWSNEDRMLLGFADDLKSSVIDSHPELSALNKEYGSFMSAYKRVAPDFKIGSTVDKLRNYSQLDPQKAQLLEGILPKDTINKIKEFETADKTSKFLKKIGLGAAGAAGMGAVGKGAWELTGH